MFTQDEVVKITIPHIWNRPDLRLPEGKRTGKIVELPNPGRNRYLVHVEIKFRQQHEGERQDWYFPEDTLAPLSEHRRMPAPDVELEEILMAQEIMEGLK